MHNEACCCFVCHNSRASLICPLCFEKCSSAELRDLLHARERRKQLADQLEAALLTQETRKEQLRKLAELRSSLATARARTQEARKLQEAASQSIRHLQSSNQGRRDELQGCTKEVQGEDGSKPRVQAEVQAMGLRQQGLRAEALEDLQRKMRVLLGAVPFRLEPSKVEGGSPGVVISGILLPNPLKPPESRKERQRLSTALGSLVLLVQWLAALLACPLLHHVDFCASTSRLWTPRSFRNEKRAPHSPVYRLYPASTAPAASPPEGSAAPASTAGAALAAIRQHLPFEAAFRSAPATPPRLQLSERRQEEDLNSAIFQLIRNVGLLCNDPLLTCLGKPVKEWTTKTTLATLAELCGHIRERARSESRLSMADTFHLPVLGASMAASRSTYPLDGEGGGEDEEVEGWDLVQRPTVVDAARRGSMKGLQLPPPPSDALNTTHWERAMITDSTARQARMPTGQALLDQLAPLGQGVTAAADRGLRLWRGIRGLP